MYYERVSKKKAHGIGYSQNRFRPYPCMEISQISVIELDRWDISFHHEFQLPFNEKNASAKDSVLSCAAAKIQGLYRNSSVYKKVSVVRAQF